MTTLLSDIGAAWVWVIGGLAVAACELLAPGAFLIWIGLAAVVTGLLLAIVMLSWEVQLLAFAALATISVLIGRRLGLLAPNALNRRGHDLVGRLFFLDAPIAGGAGRLILGDTSWRITGPDLPAGARVRVIRLVGATLEVVAG